MSEQDSKICLTYANSSRKRPEKNISGGFGKYCCVPGCKSATKNSNKQNTGIGMFSISTNPKTKAVEKTL